MIREHDIKQLPGSLSHPGATSSWWYCTICGIEYYYEHDQDKISAELNGQKVDDDLSCKEVQIKKLLE